MAAGRVRWTWKTAPVWLVIGVLSMFRLPTAAALPDTSTPALQLARIIDVTPFAGTSTSMRDGEGTAYVPQDAALWLLDDNNDSAYEVNPTTGELGRVIPRAEFNAAPQLGGGPPAGSSRTGDLEAMAYDPITDVLYAFSGYCCSTGAQPTAFRLTRDISGDFQVESHQPLPGGTDFTAAAVRPTGGTLYAGGSSALHQYTYATNTIGSTISVSGLTGILGLGFTPDGADLIVVTSAEKLRRVDWATLTLVAGWTFDLLPFGMHDSRGVDLIGDQLFVLDGLDSNPSVFVFDVLGGGDTSPPDTTIDSGPSGPTGSTSATFAFSASKPGSTFECLLDAGAFGPCGSPHSYTALSQGSHSFSVRAQDPAGNTDQSPATRTWTVDTLPPVVLTTWPTDGAISVSLASSLQATASEALAAATVTGATFTLVQTAGGGAVPATVSYDPTTMTATLDPVDPLVETTGYTATLTTQVTDQAGNPLAADRVWSFTTGAASPGIVREAVSTTANLVASPTVTIGRPSGTVPGDVLVACVALGGKLVASGGVPAGWQAIASVTSISNPHVFGYYKVAGTSEPAAYTWTLTKQVKSGGGIARYSGVDTAQPLAGGTTTAAGGAALSGTVPGVTTTVPDAMLVGCLSVNASSTGFGITSPSGMTEAWDEIGKRHEVADQHLLAPGSSGNRTWTFSDPRAWAGWLTALRPSS